MFALVLADCMTTESKAEEDMSVKELNGGCVGKIGSSKGSVVVW